MAESYQTLDWLGRSQADVEWELRRCWAPYHRANQRLPLVIGMQTGPRTGIQTEPTPS